MTFSGLFQSMLSSTPLRTTAVAAPVSPEQEALHQCITYRNAFPTTEIALPAQVLRNHAVAKWVRDQGLSVDVGTGGELVAAIAAGIHPVVMTVHADEMVASDLLPVSQLGVGRVVVSSFEQIELLQSVAEHRKHGVVVRMSDASTGFPCGTTEADDAMRTIIESERLRLVGLYCQVGSYEHDFISYPSAIGQMIAEMTHIRRHHARVTTRLGIGGGRIVPKRDWAHELPKLATQIDESLDDACATLRFPRPLVVLSADAAVTEQCAA